MTARAIPRSIGRYRIEGVLGEGAMAVVYAGFDPDIERQVAIKCLRPEVACEPAYRKRFLVEARAAGHLTHPHIVTVFDVGETDDGDPYIAMERLSGETLASRVAREGFPPLPVIIELAGQLAAALDYAHAQGVIHHDIKPENIMLGDGWQQAKINDFGIAERRRTPAEDSASRTEVGGTLAYMAPERLRGEPADARSDLFSLGVVLYWLVTRKLPWPETDELPQLITERQRLPLPAIQPVDLSTPTILVGIVRTLLAPEAAARHQRGAEIIDDLQLARREYERLDEKPLAGRLDSLRLRLAAILGTVLSLTLLLGLAAIYAKQGAAVTGLAVDFGSSLGRMVASESAEDLLLDDHAAIRALVEDIARNRQIHYLAIADRYGKIIASTQPVQLGHHLPDLGAQQQLVRSGDVESYSTRNDGSTGGGAMLLFDVPVRYQTATVGDLRLGISDAPLRAAQRTTLWVILAVLLVTLTAVVGAAFWLSRRLLGLLDLLGNAMLQVARGDYHYRIRLVRRDELGRVFAAFNLMNGALQTRQRRRRAPVTDVASEVTPRPTRIVSIPRRRADDVKPPPG